MATVPRATLPSVASAAAPDFRQQNTVDANLLNIGARQVQQLGDSMVSAGGVAEAIRKQALDQANAVRVDDALNQATEQALRLQHDPKEGYTSQKGYAALSRESGLPLADEYTGKLDQTISSIAGTLGNEEQKRLFSMRANNIRTQFFGSALQYESKENTDYTVSVREGTVKNAANALVLNYNDPQNVAQQEARIRGAILGAEDPDTKTFIPGSAQLAGKSATWAQEKAAEAVSGAHLGAIRSALESGNVNAAMAYRKQYGSKMTAADMIQIDGTLQRNYDTMQGSAVGTSVVKSALTQPNDLDRLSNIVVPGDLGKLTGVIQNVESRGRATDAAGNILQGPMTRQGTAKGDMQVMDATARDPGYGIKPADMSGSKEQQIAELRRVGQQKLAVLVKMYDGDIAKASAAYNWGEGNVDKAVKAAQANAGKGEQVAPDAWLASAPAETRNYVASVMKQMGDPAGGVPARPTLEQLQSAARERLGPNASPVAVKAALDTVSTTFEANTKAIAQRKDELVAQGYQALQQNGGRWSELSPGLRAKIQREAPDKADEMMNFGVRIAKGDDVTDDRLYLRLASNPKVLGSLTDAQFMNLRPGLSQSDFQHFSKQRADILSGKTPDTAGDLNTDAVGRFTANRLQGMGIDPTPKDGSGDAQRVGAIRRFIDSSLLDAQRTSGKKFTDAEVQKHIDGLFAQNNTFRTSFLGIPTGSTSQSLLSMKPGDVPSDARKKIEAAFKAQGNDKPSDADILGAYWAAKTTAARGGAQGSF